MSEHAQFSSEDTSRLYCAPLSGPATKEQFRGSILLEKMNEVRNSRNSVEIAGLVESALGHFKVKS